MKRIVFIQLIILTLMLASCKKENSCESAESSFVQTVTHHPDYLPAQYKYGYDSFGRIIWSKDTDSSTYTWTQDSIINFLYYLNETVPYDTVIYIRNSDGYISGYNGYEWDYDNEGHLIHTVIFDLGLGGVVDVTLTWSEGNLITKTQTYTGGSIVYNYEYYPEEDSRFSGNEFIAGKRSKNLLRSTSAPNYVRNYSYEFDSECRVIKEINDHGSITYTYY